MSLMLFNIFLVPVLDFVMKRSSPKFKLWNAGATVLAFIAVSVAYEVNQWPENFYQKLEVPRGQSKSVYRKAYKTMSVKLHPDKNPDDREGAQEKFIAMKEMFDALSGDKERRIYDRFGEEFYSNPHHEQWLDSPASMSFTLLPFYGGVIFYTCILTWSTRSARSKWWCFTLLGALLVYELLAKFDDDDYDFLFTVLPYWTIHQKIELLHILFFYVVNVLSQYAASTFVDIDAYRHGELLNAMGHILNAQREIQDELKDLRAAKGMKPRDKAAVESGAELSRRAGIERLHQRRDQAAQQAQGQGGGGTNWLQMAVYAFFIYSWWSGK